MSVLIFVEQSNMSKSMNNFFNINSIENMFIYTREGEVYAIAKIFPTNAFSHVDVFTQLLAALDVEVTFLYHKHPDTFDRYSSYFAEMISKNTKRVYLSSLLCYIQNFKECISQRSIYHLYMVFSLQAKKNYVPTIEHILAGVHLEYTWLQGDEILDLFSTLFI